MQNQTCLLQTSVKIYIYVNDISLISNLVYLCTKWTKNIQSYHLNTANDSEEIYTGKRGTNHSTGCIHRNSTLHYKTLHYIYRGTNGLLCHKAYQKRNLANLNYVNFGPHKQHSNKQAATQVVSPVYVKVAQFMGSFNTCIISIHYVAQCWEQVPPDFGNTAMMMERLELVEIFDFHMPSHGTFVQRKL
jgi:hypothetical protein